MCMDKKDLEKTAELVLRDFELETEKEKISEEELLQLLANQLAYMIEYRLEFLLSLMYRLDIDEQKCRLLPPERISRSQQEQDDHQMSGIFHRWSKFRSEMPPQFKELDPINQEDLHGTMAYLL